MAKLTGRAIFTTFQGGYPTKSKLKTLIRRSAIKSAEGIICGSDEEIARLKNDYGIKNNRIAKIFNPLDVEIQHSTDRLAARKKFGVDENAKVAVWHGRIDLHRKGLDLLVAAWQKLCRRNLPFEIQLLFLGYGNQAQEFGNLLDSVNNSTIKWFAEYTNDREKISNFLSMGDVYVFPSRHEGFPVAPIEAMSFGLPLVATKVQGIAEILENCEESGGIVVQLEDVESLTNNLEKLFLDDEFRLKLSENARRRVVESFSLEKVGLQLKEFLTKK